MPRINIEDSLFSDPRFMRLVARLGDEARALGSVVLAFRLAQKFWMPDRELITQEAWDSAGLPQALIECSLAQYREGGIYVCGSEVQFAWYFSRVDAGRAGGKASAEKRKHRSSSAQAVLDQCSSKLKQKQPSSSSSSSSSFSKERNTEEGISIGSSELRGSSSNEQPAGHVVIPALARNEKAAALLVAHRVPEKLQRAWANAYDPDWIVGEILKAQVWIEANPRRAPKKFAPFASNWLANGWERFRRTLPASNAKNRATTKLERAESLDEIWSNLANGTGE